MFKYIYCLLLVGAGITLCFGQTPCDQVTTQVYNTVFPNDPANTDNFVLLDGIVGSNGEHVAIGVRTNQTTGTHAYFLRMDASGSLITDPKEYDFIDQFGDPLYLLQLDWFPRYSAQITEIFDVAGASQGYFLSMSIYSTNQFVYQSGLLFAHLDGGGNVLSYNVQASSKYDFASVDCIQRNDNRNMTVLSRQNENSDPMIPHFTHFVEVNPLTCAIVGQYQSQGGFVTTIEPYKIEQFYSGSGLQFLVTAQIDSSNVKYIGTTVFNGDYSVANYGKGFINVNTAVSNETPYPTGLVMGPNNTAYISGYYETSANKYVPFLMQIGIPAATAAPTIIWTKQAPIVGLGDGTRFLDMIKTSTGSLAIIGNSNGLGISAITQYKFDGSGTLVWARQAGFPYGGVNYVNQFPTAIRNSADGGYWHIGFASQNNTNTPARNFAMKVNADGWVDDCDCVSNVSLAFQSIQSGVIAFFPGSSSDLLNQYAITQTTTPHPMPQSFCSQSTTCQVSIAWNPLPDCNGVFLHAVPVSGTGPYTFSWDFFGDNTPDAAGQDVVFSGAPPGVYQMCVTMTDASGCTSAFCGPVEVMPDQIPPQIYCYPPDPVHAPACAGGANVFFNLPEALDNCALGDITISHQPGDFFPCGTTNVTATATDIYGNIATCSFPVTVICSCGEIQGADLDCTANPALYLFTVVVENQTGSPGTCALNVTSADPDISVLTQMPVWSGNTATITGLVQINSACTPVNVFLNVDMTCQCPGGPVNCSLPFTLDVPCCQTVTVADGEVCKSAPQFTVPLIGCAALPDVQQVRWYVAYAPCPPIGDAAWGAPYQVTSGCNDLLLLPAYLTGDVCVYAEVQQGSCAGACQLITSNVATIQLCEPLNISVSSSAPGPFCSTAVPGAMTLTAAYDAMGCSNSIQWYDASGPISGGSGNSITVSGLSYSGAPISDPDNCYREYLYRAVVTQPCGSSEGAIRIRIYNDNAGAGTLTLLAPDLPKLCAREDVQIQYAPECAENPPTGPMWQWQVSTDGSTYSPVAGSGTVNPLYNSNLMSSDHWFKVTKQNGVCPADETSIFIDFEDTVAVSAFSATPLDACRESGVKLEVLLASASSCNARIDWYKGWTLIHTGIYSAGTFVYNYTDASLMGDYSGNYYVVVTNLCCGDVEKSSVVQVRPPCKMALLAPCFRCNTETVTLEVISENCDGPCHYQWYKWYGTWMPIAGNDAPVLPSDYITNTFKVEMDCGGCLRTAEVQFDTCGTFVSATNTPLRPGALQMQPNPAADRLAVELPNPDSRDALLRMTDINGRVVLEARPAPGDDRHELSLKALPPGLYILQYRTERGLIGTGKVVKE